MSPARIDLAELSPEVREQLGLLAPSSNGGRRRRGLTKDEVRTHALRVLAVVAQLTRAQRVRVLAHADRLNAL